MCACWRTYAYTCGVPKPTRPSRSLAREPGPAFTRERGGWRSWDIPGLSASVRTHVAWDEGGRPVIKELRISGDDLTGDQLSRLPVRQMVATLLAQDTRGDVVIDVSQEAADKYVRGEYLLGRPPRTDGDKFYGLVALTYIGLAAITPAPSAWIAATEDVPIATVRRWIVEARRRNLLPPARKGVAG
jgi:hypothetical protein